MSVDRSARNVWLMLVPIAVLLAAPSVCGWWIGGPSGNYRAWQIAYVVGCLGLCGWFWIRRVTPKATRLLNRPVILVALAAMLRVPLLFTAPDTDCARYIWEGRMANLGFSPYLHSPQAPELEPFRDDVWQQIIKKQYATIYPPLSMGVMRLVAAAWYDVRAIQWCVGLLDLLLVAMLVWMLRRLNRDSSDVAIYAFNPLVLASFAQAGHIDVLMLGGLVVMAFGILISQQVASPSRGGRVAALPAAGLGMAILAKTIPVALLPLLWKRCGRFVVLAMAIVALGYLPLAADGSGLFATAFKFAESGRFGGFLEVAVPWRIPMRMHIADWRVSLRTVVSGVVVLGAILWTLRSRSRDPMTAMLIPLTALLLTLPIVHFWYATWLIVLGVFLRRWTPALLTLSMTMVLYWQAPASAAGGGRWSLTGWEQALIWWPFVACLCLIPRSTLHRDSTRYDKSVQPS